MIHENRMSSDYGGISALHMCSCVWECGASAHTVQFTSKTYVLCEAPIGSTTHVSNMYAIKVVNEWSPVLRSQTIFLQIAIIFKLYIYLSAKCSHVNILDEI